MTADDFEAEAYRQRRKQRPRLSCTTVLIGAAAILLAAVRLAGVAIDRIGAQR